MTKTRTTGTTRNHSTTSHRRHRLAILATAATATTILTGCSNANSTAPTSAPATTSAASPDPAASLEAEKAKVISAYDAYLQATVRLYAGGKADPKILEGAATPEAARKDAQGAAVMFSAGDRMVGTLTATPRSVRITGDTATLITCVDDSKWISVKLGATPTPGETGSAPGLARVQMVRSPQGGWLFKHTEGAGSC